eukprot:scaffold24896_cov32-Tisochrysis_lutea.AAC.2
MWATAALVATAWVATPSAQVALPSSRPAVVSRHIASDQLRMQLSEMELAEQAAKLDALSAKWSKRQQQMEEEQAGQIGWVKAAEATNGRFAMFFLPVGLITEYYTGESLPQQVYTLLQTLGFVEVSYHAGR